MVVLSVTSGKESKGLRDYALKDLPPLIHRNPRIQFTAEKDKTDLPNIRFFLEGGDELFIDAINKSAKEIQQLLEQAGAATSLENELREDKEERAAVRNDNPGNQCAANFGKYGHMFCICMKGGQVPCPSRVNFITNKGPKPFQMRQTDD